MNTLINTRSAFFFAKMMNGAVLYQEPFAVCPTCMRKFYEEIEYKNISSEAGECTACEQHREEALIGAL
jgi:hypothetical protein